MLGAQGKHKGVVRRRGLQFEIERAAKPFPQRQSPRAVHPYAKRRVDDQLHSAGLIEEPLHYNFLLRRNNAQRQMSRGEIISELSRARFAKAGFGHEPLRDFLADQASFPSLVALH